MLPSITLGGPDDLFAIIDVESEFAACGESWPEVVVVEECRHFFIDDGAGVACVRIYLDDFVSLMAALIVLEGEAAAVLPPDRRAEIVRVGEQRVVDLVSLMRRYIKE